MAGSAAHARVRAGATPLAGPLVVEPTVYCDARGSFFESWHQERYRELGLDAPFVQDNVSRSLRGVLRGLHLQHPHGQAKLVSVLHGEVFDVAVDVRVGSPTFGRWAGYRLSAENHRQLYVPPGFAHGFAVTSAEAVVAYKVTAYYHAASDVAVAWNDPELGIEWPLPAPLLSERDARAPRLRDIPADRLPAYAGPR